MKIYGVVGWKNAGKTGLMERLIADITARGFSVSTVKHAHHSFDVDHPGKDSHRHRIAGAREVLLASRNRFALMHELTGEDEPPLDELLAKLAPVDLVLVEGYKRDKHPKIEAHRAETGNALIADETVRAFAADCVLNMDRPVFDLNDTAQIAEFLLRDLGLLPALPAAAQQDISKDLLAPKLSNDCFALPAGVTWTPVDEALEMLKARLAPVTAARTTTIDSAAGLVLARDAIAQRAHPPEPNSAVDGYGFAGGTLGDGPQMLPLIEGRSAAGVPFAGVVPAGSALRILTGAALPGGIDTVVLEEDVNSDGKHIAFNGPIKAGNNTRRAGEDVLAGEVILKAGRRLTPADTALLSAVGIATVKSYERLRVGVLSTGDELVEAGKRARAGQIYDANRPMLLAQLNAWGFEAIDLGRAPDDRADLHRMLDAGAGKCDAILTSGGASAGDEDHMSAILAETGSLAMGRIALKPGRPLALGIWNGTPVFG
ncbi:MAG: molybdopterin-guanine dinucleotide biosynthesis protein B, partial [Planktotalea sp.]|uniref:molybdopterin-guanine dinucleotide biosynthesis protein B n=1 Tax=Planktotalea sp. TaxID=2029877 RepID=UPI003C71414B